MVAEKWFGMYFLVKSINFRLGTWFFSYLVTGFFWGMFSFRAKKIMQLACFYKSTAIQRSIENLTAVY